MVDVSVTVIYIFENCLKKFLKYKKNYLKKENISLPYNQLSFDRIEV